jgi:hypothetical protein
MRKVLWCSTMLAIMAAGAIYLTADYATRNPRSLVGRCLIATSNPIGQFGHSAAGQTCAMEKNSDEPSAVPGTPVEIVLEPAERPRSARPFLSTIVIPSDDEVLTAPPESSQPPLAPTSGDAEEAEEPMMPSATEVPSAPSRMPYASEGVEAPAYMPYAVDDQATDLEDWVFNFCWGIFEEAFSHCTDRGTAEESELTQPANRDHADPFPSVGPCPGTCDHEGTGPTITRHERTLNRVNRAALPPAKPSARKKGMEETPTHPEVDTMEFRRSDGRPCDFDNFPF